MISKQQMNDEAEIRNLIADWSRAIERKDAAGAVKYYTADTVLHDVGDTFVGAEAVKKLWETCFPFFPETFKSEHQDLKVEVDGDLAFIHGQHRFIPEPADHPCGQFLIRVTAGLRRIDGRWYVLHEHASIPFKMEGSGPTEAGDKQPHESSAIAKAAAQGIHSITPHLVCQGAAEAIDFYKKAFDAKELVRLPGKDGRLLHACLQINGSSVMLADEYPKMGTQSPTTLKATSVTIHLVVEDADEAAQKAVAAGAKIIMPVEDMFWGDRYGIVEDPFGHFWSFATPKRVVHGKDLEKAAADAFAQHGQHH